MHNPSYDCYVDNHNIGLDLVVYESGYEECNPLHCWGPDKKACYVFHYVLSGKGKLYLGDRIFDIVAGDCFLVSPEDLCYYEADVDDPWKYKWVGFDGLRSKSIMSMTRFTGANPITNILDNYKTEKFLDDIFTSYKSEFAPNIKALGNLYLFLAWLIEAYPNESRNTATTGEQNFYNMLRYISVQYKGRIKVSEMADALHYDRSYLYKMFIKQSGMSPSEYLEIFRIKKACELISDGKQNIYEIASSVGYDNYNWFFIVFKRRMGCSPEAFSKMSATERLKYDNEKLQIVDKMIQSYNHFMADKIIL